MSSNCTCDGSCDMLHVGACKKAQIAEMILKSAIEDITNKECEVTPSMKVNEVLNEHQRGQLDDYLTSDITDKLKPDGSSTICELFEAIKTSL